MPVLHLLLELHQRLQGKVEGSLEILEAVLEVWLLREWPLVLEALLHTKQLDP